MPYSNYKKLFSFWKLGFYGNMRVFFSQYWAR